MLPALPIKAISVSQVLVNALLHVAWKEPTNWSAIPQTLTEVARINTGQECDLASIARNVLCKIPQFGKVCNKVRPLRVLLASSQTKQHKRRSHVGHCCHMCFQRLAMQKQNAPTSGNSRKNRSNSCTKFRSVYNSDLKHQTSPVTLHWKIMERKVSRWSLDAASDQEAHLGLGCPSSRNRP